MADIALTRRIELPENWQIVAQTHERQLAIEESPVPYSVSRARFGNVWVAVLSHSATCDDVWAAINAHGANCLDGLRDKGPVAGVVWNMATDEFFVFRDIFGWTIWMVVEGEAGPESVTTSPRIHQMLVRGKPLNRAWFGHFLQFQDSVSNDDIYEGTRRIRPGESWLYHESGRDFLTLDDAQTNEVCRKKLTISGYWQRRQYEPLRADYAEITSGLRQEFMAAVDRIPVEDPCFTLSGGMDSSGILAAWNHLHPEKRLSAFSLVSGKHASCDESEQLNVLEKAFPLNLHRVNMDDLAAETLRIPDLYRRCGVYGPMIAPGIEMMMLLYREIEQNCGHQMIITGYGGNHLVKVRTESQWRGVGEHILSKDAMSMVGGLLKNEGLTGLRRALGRFMGNVLDGQIRRTYQELFKNKRPVKTPAIRQFLAPVFAAQFPGERIDPVFELSHTEERRRMPLSWQSECQMRQIDWMVRQTQHRFYDPLYDPILYDYCARIPPIQMSAGGEYRRIYRDALKDWLPEEIIFHPKVQHFDESIDDGLREHAGPILEEAIGNHPEVLSSMLDLSKISGIFDQFLETPSLFGVGGGDVFWRILSLCLWVS